MRETGSESHQCSQHRSTLLILHNQLSRISRMRRSQLPSLGNDMRTLAWGLRAPRSPIIQTAHLSPVRHTNGQQQGVPVLSTAQNCARRSDPGRATVQATGRFRQTPLSVAAALSENNVLATF